MIYNFFLQTRMNEAMGLVVLKFALDDKMDTATQRRLNYQKERVAALKKHGQKVKWVSNCKFFLIFQMFFLVY